MFKRLFTVAALVALLASPVFAQSSGYVRLLKDSAGVTLSGVQKTATFNSEILNLQGWPTFCLVMDIDWTAGSLVTTVQMSLDGGSSFYDIFPDGLNSETQAVMTSIGSDVAAAECWRNPFPVVAGFSTGASAINPRARFVFTLATSPDVVFNNAYIVTSESP